MPQLRRALFPVLLIALAWPAWGEVFRVTNNQNVGATFGLDPSNTYTHKLDFPNPPNDSTPINGVAFSPAAAGAGTDSLTGNGYNLSIPGLTTFTAAGSANMIQDFYYSSAAGSGVRETLSLSGLTPGEVYDARFYYRNFGTRPNTVTVDTGGGTTPWVGTLDQDTTVDQNYHSFLFKADSSTATFNFVEHVDASWHQYGVTNQEAAAPAVGETRNILGLYPTGVDDNGSPLPNGAADPHYRFVSGPQTSAQNPQATVQSNHPAWFANDGGSKWIGVTGSGANNVATGTYLYEMTFDLPAEAELNSVVLGGDWWADDAGLLVAKIFLNGDDTLFVGDPAFNSATGTPFLITDGMNGASFVHGENTLGFSVDNAGTGPNPHGLRVANLFGTFETSATGGGGGGQIPEPASIAIWSLIGLVLAGYGCWRRQKQQIRSTVNNRYTC